MADKKKNQPEKKKGEREKKAPVRVELEDLEISKAQDVKGGLKKDALKTGSTYMCPW